jgi:polyhydroxyalkanoate synthesis regulator phasin
MNDLFKKAVQAGLGFAVITTEKAKDIVEDLLEKSKYYQEKFSNENESDSKEEEVDGEAVNDSDHDEVKNSRLEEFESKVRKLIESTVSRFNFVKNEEYDRVEKRIEALEKKLNQLVKEIVDSKKQNKGNI